MNHAITVAAAVILLTACATPTVTKTEIQVVKEPVAVQPITPAQVPQPPAPLGKRPESLSAAADVLLAKVCELESYAIRADPLLRISAGENAQQLIYPECSKH